MVHAPVGKPEVLLKWNWVIESSAPLATVIGEEEEMYPLIVNVPPVLTIVAPCRYWWWRGSQRPRPPR